MCIVGIFQIIFLYVKLRFPYWIFNSNIAYYQGYKQYIESFRRVVSTFTEASCAGAFLASIESGFLISIPTRFDTGAPKIIINYHYIFNF